MERAAEKERKMLGWLATGIAEQLASEYSVGFREALDVRARFRPDRASALGGN